MRVGIGYDRHPLIFSPGSHLRVGGVVVAKGVRFQAHSDGDVLLHALCDAILGALGLGDMGEVFPSSDDRWKNANSEEFLRIVVDVLRKRRMRVVNVDSVVIGDSVRLSPHREAMRNRIAQLLGLDSGSVNVKFKRAEGLGFESSTGFSAYAVVLIE